MQAHPDHHWTVLTHDEILLIFILFLYVLNLVSETGSWITVCAGLPYCTPQVLRWQGLAPTDSFPPFSHRICRIQKLASLDAPGCMVHVDDSVSATGGWSTLCLPHALTHLKPTLEQMLKYSLIVSCTSEMLLSARNFPPDRLSLSFSFQCFG